MDWFSWLSKSGLEPSLVYEYGLEFAHNELEKEDIAYFNHEFLQSMGISIAKHRLEILKLARREKSQQSHGLKHPMSKLFLALKKTKKSLASYITTLFHRDDNRALIVVPNKNNKKNKNKGGVISYSSRWKKAMMMRNINKQLVMVNSNYQDRLMITNGDDNNLGDNDHEVGDVSTPRLDSYSSPLIYDLHQNKEETVHDDDQEDEYWTPSLEEIKWDAMFHDLKPT